ncbi:MAG: hypothetical protein IPK19_13035 [Chloroflexi bacterium]|nr:hypothetical protein [Chloroflexota bacterium]
MALVGLIYFILGYFPGYHHGQRFGVAVGSAQESRQYASIWPVLRCRSSR